MVSVNALFLGSCLLSIVVGATARPPRIYRRARTPDAVDLSQSCVTAGYRDCCNYGNDPQRHCELIGMNGRRCYCDSSCYESSNNDCCSDIQQTCHDPYEIQTARSVDTPVAGKLYSFICTVEIQPGTPTIVWLGPNGTEIQTTQGEVAVDGPLRGSSSHHNPTFTLTLTFKPLRTSHAGRYVCKSVAGLVTMFSRETLDVTIPAPLVYLSDIGQHCYGDSLILNCTVVVDPSVDTSVSILVHGMGPNGSLNSTRPTLISSRKYRSDLMLHSVQSTDSGNYSCIATIFPEQVYVGRSDNGSKSLSITVCLTVSLIIEYRPPADFDYDPNVRLFRAASGPFSVVCQVNGSTGGVTYKWQSPSTPTTTNNSVVRPLLLSRDTGGYTCIVNDTSGSSGEASTTVTVIGAGVAIENSGQGLPNNSAIVVDGGLELSCRSGALTAGVGDLIGVDGRFLLANVSFSAIDLGTLSIWRKTTFNAIQIRHSTTAPDLAAEVEGVYTCRMPDENGKTIDVNFGLYRRQLPVPPRVINLSNNMNRVLNCTSTDSLPTTVTWTKEGRDLTLDGSNYTLMQVLIDRRRSMYENLLILPDGLEALGKYSCTVTNILGTSTSNDVQVTVSDPYVQIYNTTGNYTYAGTNLTLTCTIEVDLESLGDTLQYFKLTSTWTDTVGVKLYTGDHIHIVNTEELQSSVNVYTSLLAFDPLSINDTGKYTCMAALELKDIHVSAGNFRGVGSSTIFIVIQSPIEVSLMTNTSYLPNVAPYNSFTLTCTATTIPSQLSVSTVKSFVWKQELLNGTLTEIITDTIDRRDTNLYQRVSTSTLIVKKSAAGEYHYYCQVDIGDLGVNVSDDEYIKVNGPSCPMTPVVLWNTNISFHSTTISWMTVSIAFTSEIYVIHFGISYYYMELSSDPVESGPEFAGLNKIFSIDIDGLLPGTTYYYWIVAKNSFGSSQSVVQSFTTTSSVFGSFAINLHLGGVVKIRYQQFHIYSVILSRHSTTTVTGVIANTAGMPLVLTFQARFPRTAFISKFTVSVNGITYHGMVQKKQVGIHQSGHSLSSAIDSIELVQINDTYVLTARVNADRNNVAVFVLQYEELIVRDLSRYKQTFYINPGTVVDDLRVTVRAIDPEGIIQPAASEFASIYRISNDEVIFTYSPTVQQQTDTSKGLNKQLFIEYDVDHSRDVGLILANECYFIQFFSPRDVGTVPADLVFVIDVSGSMSGRKIEQTKDAINTIIDDLNPEDRLEIVTFSNSVHQWMHQLVSVGTYEQQAKLYVNALKAQGGTDLKGGVVSGASILKSYGESDHAQIMVVLTDGHPTSGTTDPDDIVQDVTNFLNGTPISLNSLGFGTNLNFDLLKRLSLSNNGIAKQIYESDDAESQLEGFFQSIVAPALSSVSVSYEGGTVDNITDTKFPLFYNDSEIVVGGKFSAYGAKAFTIHVQVTGTGQSGFQIFESLVDPLFTREVSGLVSDVERMVAHLNIQHLLNDRVIADKSEAAEIDLKIIELALQYSLLVQEVSELIVSNERENFMVVNSTSTRIENETTVIQVVKDAIFQVRLPEDCTVWSPATFYDQVPSGLLQIISKGVADRCGYRYSSERIQESGGLGSLKNVTYRSTLHGTRGHSAEELMGCTEQWIGSELSVRLGSLWVDIESSCSVNTRCPSLEPPVAAALHIHLD